MDQTFVCCSTYHVYLSILEAYKAKRQGHESVLIFYVDVMEGISEFIDNVDKIGIFKRVLKVNGYTMIRTIKKHYSMRDYFLNRAKIYVDMFDKHYPELVELQPFIANSEINLFQINRTRAYFIIKFPDNFFRMYEDGYGTYTQKLKFLRYLNRKYITKFPVLKGHDPQIQEVMVSYPEKMVDPILIPKVKKLDIRPLEDAISDEDKSRIVRSLIGDTKVQNQNATIVITQPLSEDGICTETQKKILFEELIKAELANGNIVYLKTHPRERTVYTYDYPGFYHLPKFFPLEVFNLSSHMRIERAVSFYSTALYNLKHVDDKVLLGEEHLHKEIEKLTKAGRV
ncbi:MAG TPA: glycosyltransferase family 52 [Flavobacterium sp.]|jgi:hypothetical protein